MTFVYILMWTCMVLAGASAILALLWAIRTGQMSNLNQAAASIFDDDEPIGTPTDSFPGAAR